MDCRQAQDWLEFATIGREEPGPDAVAARRHLADCDACRLAFQAWQSFDRELARAMPDVPVPPGLADRLMSAVATESARAAAQTEPAAPAPALPAPPRGRSRGWIKWGLVAAAPLLVWGALLLAPGRSALNDASMRELARVDLNSLALETRQTFVLPRGWNSVRGVQLGDAPRLAQVNGVQVPILAFLVRTDRRASHATGVLVRIPRSRWQGTAASPSFSSAPIQYASFGTWAVWSEVDTVFVCLLQGDPQAMQRLQELVSGRRELT